MCNTQLSIFIVTKPQSFKEQTQSDIFKSKD